MPPVGAGLSVGATIAKITVARAGWAPVPPVATTFSVTLVIACVPRVTHVLPRLLGW